MLDVKGPLAASAAPHALSVFAVEHLISPPAPATSSRWSRAFPFLLALILNLAFLFALFYRVAYTLPPMSREKESIPVELVQPKNAPPPPRLQQQPPQPKPQPEPEQKPEPKPEPEQAKPYEFKGSGDVKKDKAGHAPVVKADDTKAKPEKKAVKPKDEAPKQEEADIPDWAKTQTKGYDIPEPKASSRRADHGQQTQRYLDNRSGNGGGDEYSNKISAQINSHTNISPDLLLEIDRSAIVLYAIDRRGALRGVRLVQSSGNKEFDLRVLQGILTAAPFPAFPKGAPADMDMVSYSWVYPEKF
ncbi:MAG: TonB family protein [Pseudomonadota bacterium]